MKQLNHREKTKKLGAIIITGLIIMIVSVSIAYAALSETLTISGSGTVTSIDWDLSMGFYSGYKYGTATYTTPVVNGTTISYSVNLKKPGDTVELIFKVYNKGDIKAEVSSIINSTPVCTSSTGNTADEALVCNNLEISMKYLSNKDVSIGDVVNRDNYVCFNGQSSTYYESKIEITVKLKDSMTEVPSSDVTLSNMKHDIMYVQSDKTCTTNTSCFVAGTKVLTEAGYKNIEDIKVNDYVYAMNEETNQYELKKVLQKFDSITSQLYKLSVADHIIETTSKHKFYVVDKGWIPASELKEGDKLSSSEDIDTTITKIEIVELNEKLPVYNMEVEGHHNYLITEDNLLVHNAGSPIPK